KTRTAKRETNGTRHLLTPNPYPLTPPKEPPMIVVMEQVATQSQINHVIQLIKELGLREHVIAGTERTVIAALGDDRAKNKENIENAPGVEKVMPVLAKYKMASREVKKDRTVVNLGGTLGATVGTRKVCIIAGPCSVESREQL